MKVLIAIDDSDCSLAAFDSILQRSWSDDSQFRVITVIEPFNVVYPLAAGYVEPMIEAQRSYTDYCLKMIEARTAQLEKAFPKAKATGEVLEGNVPACILKEASDWSADLLVVGSHGRKGLEKFLLGSVAERVATHAPCSVEIVKHKSVTAKQSTNSELKTTPV